MSPSLLTSTQSGWRPVGYCDGPHWNRQCHLLGTWSKAENGQCLGLSPWSPVALCRQLSQLSPSVPSTLSNRWSNTHVDRATLVIHLPFSCHPEVILHCCHQLCLVCNQISTDQRFGTFWDYESLLITQSSERLSAGQSLWALLSQHMTDLRNLYGMRQFNFSMRDAKKNTPDIDFL